MPPASGVPVAGAWAGSITSTSIGHIEGSVADGVAELLDDVGDAAVLERTAVHDA